MPESEMGEKKRKAAASKPKRRLVYRIQSIFSIQPMSSGFLPHCMPVMAS